MKLRPVDVPPVTVSINGLRAHHWVNLCVGGHLVIDLTEEEALELANELVDKVEVARKSRSERRRRAKAQSRVSEDP